MKAAFDTTSSQSYQEYQGHLLSLTPIKTLHPHTVHAQSYTLWEDRRQRHKEPHGFFVVVVFFFLPFPAAVAFFFFSPAEKRSRTVRKTHSHFSVCLHRPPLGFPGQPLVSLSHTLLITAMAGPLSLKNVWFHMFARSYHQSDQIRVLIPWRLAQVFHPKHFRWPTAVFFRFLLDEQVLKNPVFDWSSSAANGF